MTVRPKKQLGQHFLKEESIANKIVNALSPHESSTVIEVGPGMGVLTKYLLEVPQLDVYVVEIDDESVEYLKKYFPILKNRIINEDFLSLKLDERFAAPYSIIGNFPYNISSQILFKILEHRDSIPAMVGMFQKEVADRVVSRPGSKVYGILSVLIQAFYTTEYLFTVEPGSFIPPPKVRSAVIRLRRNTVTRMDCDEKLFFRVVKTAFNQRRKTLRNALSSMGAKDSADPMFDKRAEQLSVNDFIHLTKILDPKKNDENDDPENQ